MSGELDPRLAQALREDAYRVPVTVTAGELRRRLEAERRQRTGWGWLGAIAAAAAIGIVALTSWSHSTRPPMSGSSATPGQCAESPATTHGDWWVEVGGPNAFFNIEPGTRNAIVEGTWLLFVRFDPDAGSGEEVSISAGLEATSKYVAGRLNSKFDRSAIVRFDSPAPPLPGGWYLFELDIDQPGCWELSASIDERVVGTATVLVAPGLPEPTGPARSPPEPTEAPATVPPTPAVGAIRVNVSGTARECRSEGGCGWFLELVGEGRRDRRKLSTALPADLGPDDPVTYYELELATPIDPLEPGTYTATFTSFRYSDVRIGEEPPEAELAASCSIGFGSDLGAAGVVVVASFTDSDCSASIKYIVSTGLPFQLSCGPIEPTRCRELADRAVEAVLLRYPGAHAVSLEFFSVVGDYTLVLDNGTAITLIID
jgi:hypothetical protein